MTGTLITEPLQSLAHRSVHPLPPKPTTGPPPPPLPSSSYVGNTSPNKQHSSSQNDGEVKFESSAQLRSQVSKNRRSASPPHLSETNYRKRDSRKSQVDNESPRLRGGIEKDTIVKQVTENADMRRRGSAVMEIYRWVLSNHHLKLGWQYSCQPSVVVLCLSVSFPFCSMVVELFCNTIFILLFPFFLGFFGSRKVYECWSRDFSPGFFFLTQWRLCLLVRSPFMNACYNYYQQIFAEITPWFHTSFLHSYPDMHIHTHTSIFEQLYGSEPSFSMLIPHTLWQCFSTDYVDIPSFSSPLHVRPILLLWMLYFSH